MDFNIGDKVRVRSDIESGKPHRTKNGEIWFSSEMVKYRGKIYQVRAVGTWIYFDPSPHYWAREWLEKVQNRKINLRPKT